LPVLTSDLLLTPVEFNQRFKRSPVRRAKRRGYLRNMAVAAGNRGHKRDMTVLKQIMQHEEPMVQEHVQWAIGKLENE
jgi:epoxyqueuosine reductase